MSVSLLCTLVYLCGLAIIPISVVTDGWFVQLYAYSMDLWPPTFQFPQDSHRWGRCFGNLNGCPSNCIRKITWDLSGLSSWCLLIVPWYLPDTQYLKSLSLWLSSCHIHSHVRRPSWWRYCNWLARGQHLTEVQRSNPRWPHFQMLCICLRLRFESIIANLTSNGWSLPGKSSTCTGECTRLGDATCRAESAGEDLCTKEFHPSRYETNNSFIGRMEIHMDQHGFKLGGSCLVILSISMYICIAKHFSHPLRLFSGHGWPTRVLLRLENPSLHPVWM